MEKVKPFQDRWWKAEPGRVHEALFSAVRDMETDQSGRRSDNAVLRSLFKAKGARASIHGDDLPIRSLAHSNGVWRYNLIRTVVDVLSAKVGRGKPKASFVTTGGTWSEQRQAKRLDKYVFGVMHAADFYREARKVFRDAAVTDIGVVKGWVENGKVCMTRVDPDEIKVSMADAYYGKPQTLVHSYCVSRDAAHGWVDAWHPEAKVEERERMHGLVDKAEIGRAHV